MDKIHGYLPIITKEKATINESILTVYVMKKMIKAFAKYFNTEPEHQKSVPTWLFFNATIPSIFS